MQTATTHILTGTVMRKAFDLCVDQCMKKAR